MGTNTGAPNSPIREPSAHPWVQIQNSLWEPPGTNFWLTCGTLWVRILDHPLGLSGNLQVLRCTVTFGTTSGPHQEPTMLPLERLFFSQTPLELCVLRGISSQVTLRRPKMGILGLRNKFTEISQISPGVS